MTVFSIHPDSGTYFKDVSDCVSVTDKVYCGYYNQTPIYPLYTFSINGRFNYESQTPKIEFYTMLPIERRNMDYLVEIRQVFIINIYEKDSFNNYINEFNKFCEMNKTQLDIKSLF